MGTAICINLNHNGGRNVISQVRAPCFLRVILFVKYYSLLHALMIFFNPLQTKLMDQPRCAFHILEEVILFVLLSTIIQEINFVIFSYFSYFLTHVLRITIKKSFRI